MVIMLAVWCGVRWVKRELLKEMKKMWIASGESRIKRTTTKWTGIITALALFTSTKITLLVFTCFSRIFFQLKGSIEQRNEFYMQTVYVANMLNWKKTCWEEKKRWDAWRLLAIFFSGKGRGGGLKASATKEEQIVFRLREREKNTCKANTSKKVQDLLWWWGVEWVGLLTFIRR